jgi:hypothetical protein
VLLLSAAPGTSWECASCGSLSTAGAPSSMRSFRSKSANASASTGSWTRHGIVILLQVDAASSWCPSSPLLSRIIESSAFRIFIRIKEITPFIACGKRFLKSTSCTGYSPMIHGSTGRHSFVYRLVCVSYYCLSSLELD